MGIDSNSISVTVLAPAFYSSYYNVRYLMLSAQRHGVEVRWYGLNEQFKGWVDTHVTRLKAELERVETSHVLFTDASDALFLRGMDEIIRRYKGMGAPGLLVSVEDDGLNAGGWMGRVSEAKKALAVIEKQTDGDPQLRWRHAVEQGMVMVDLDMEDRVFQVGFGVDDKLNGCLLHFAGGYTDPEVGKKELIEPTWLRLGYGK